MKPGLRQWVGLTPLPQSCPSCNPVFSSLGVFVPLWLIFSPPPANPVNSVISVAPSRFPICEFPLFQKQIQPCHFRAKGLNRPKYGNNLAED
jgi:hypothetical protein